MALRPTVSIAWARSEVNHDPVRQGIAVLICIDRITDIGGTIPKVISPVLLDVVEVLAEIPDSQFGEISITGYAKV